MRDRVDVLLDALRVLVHDQLDAILRRFMSQIHLHENLNRTSRAVRRIVDFPQESTRIDGLDCGEGDRLFRLVRLKMSDEMPAKREVRGLGHL